MVRSRYDYDGAYYQSGMDGWHTASFPCIARVVEGEIGQDDEVLDLGCGDGFYGRELARRARAVDGLDISTSMETSPNRHFYRGFESADLGVPLGRAHRRGYDVVFSSEVVEHVADYRAFLRNAHEALRPGGKLVLTTTTYSCALPVLLETKPRLLLGRPAWTFLRGWFGSEEHRTRFTMLLWEWTKGHYHGFSKSQLRDALETAGFVDVRISYLHIMPAIYMEFFDNPFRNVRARVLVLPMMRLLKQVARAVNATCRALDIYAPNVLVVARRSDICKAAET